MSKHDNPDLLHAFQNVNDVDGEKNQVNIFKTAINELFSRKKLSTKTEFSKSQVIPFAMAEIYIKKYKSKTMRKFIDEYMLKAISIDRKGREDFVNLIRSASSGDEQETNLMSKLFGSRG